MTTTEHHQRGGGDGLTAERRAAIEAMQRFEEGRSKPILVWMYDHAEEVAGIIRELLAEIDRVETEQRWCDPGTVPLVCVTESWLSEGYEIRKANLVEEMTFETFMEQFFPHLVRENDVIRKEYGR